MGTIIGIDEVGRGCWAGPLLIVAARQVAELPSGLVDSKLLSRKQRERLMDDISLACELGEGWVQPAEIDDMGLTAAMRLGVARALAAVDAGYNEAIIMDGNFNYCDTDFTEVRAVIKADASYPIVSAASIHAKVRRDNYMASLGEPYRKYEFAKHVGYGTKLHHDLLRLHGVSDQHRLSFKQVHVVKAALA